MRAAAETATEDPDAGAPATMHAAAEAAEVQGIGVPTRVLAAVEAAAEPPSAQEARGPLGRASHHNRRLKSFHSTRQLVLKRSHWLQEPKFTYRTRLASQ